MVDIYQDLPTSKDEVRVELLLGAAKLKIGGGSKALVDGTVVYNVPDWEPKMEYSDQHLVIKQDETKISGFPSKQLKNEWDLNFTNDRPLDMTINAGAYQGDMDFGGINLTRLVINDGASDTTVNFSKPNSGVMDEFEYTSGASTVELLSLGNANFERMNFSAGAGTYTLEFSGELRQDADVHIGAGVSTIKIIVPEGRKARVVVDGELNDVNTQGTWTVASNSYNTQGTGNMLDIYVSMSVGALELVQK